MASLMQLVSSTFASSFLEPMDKSNQTWHRLNEGLLSLFKPIPGPLPRELTTKDASCLTQSIAEHTGVLFSNQPIH